MGKRDTGCLCNCSCKKKSQGSAVTGTFFIAFILLFVFLTHAVSLDIFDISVENKTNLAGTPVRIEVTGPNTTNFTLNIYQNLSLILSQNAITSATGRYLTRPNFSIPGRYTANLSENNLTPAIASTWFYITLPDISQNNSTPSGHPIQENHTNKSARDTTQKIPSTISTTANKPEPEKNSKATIAIKDAKKRTVKAKIILKQANTQKKGISSLGTPDNRYKVQILPEQGAVKKIEFHDLEISGDTVELGLDDTPETGRTGVAEIYAIDPTRLNFTEAKVTAIAKGYELLKCKDWNFEKQECFGEWKKLMDLTPGEEYTFTITPDDPAFSETTLYYSTSNNNARKIVRDSKGNLYFVYAKEYLVNHHIYVAKSTDDGYTWSDIGGGPIEDAGAYDQERPAMAIDGNDNLHVVWHGADTGSNGEEKVKYSNYTGSSWSGWINISHITGHIQESPSIVIDTSNNLHIVWEGGDAINTFKQIKYINRTTSGWSSWLNIDVISEHEQLNPCAVFDSSENLHVFWYGKDATYSSNSQIKYSNRTASGWSSWINIQSIASYSQGFVSATIDSSDNIHTTWQGMDSASPTETQIKYSNRTATGWSGWVNIYHDPATAQGSPSIVPDSNDTIHIFWLNGVQLKMSTLNTTWSTYTVVPAGTSRYPTTKWSQFFNNNPTTGDVIDFGWTYGSASPYNLTYSYYITNPNAPYISNYTGYAQTDVAITNNLSKDDAIYADNTILVRERDTPINETTIDATWNTTLESVSIINNAAITIKWFYNISAGTGAEYYKGHIQVLNHTGKTYIDACMANIPKDNPDNFRCNITSFLNPANLENITIRFLFEVKNTDLTEDNNDLYIDSLHLDLNYTVGPSEATIETNATSYNQQDTVGITGAGWQPNTEITLNLTYPNMTNVETYPKNTTSDSSGNINDTWASKKHSPIGTYNLTAFQWNNTSANDTASFTVNDAFAPEHSDQDQTINSIHVDIIHTWGTINLTADWQDNIALDTAWLSTNETGQWSNNTFQELTTTSNTSTYSWQNTSITPSTTIAWKIYANDTSGLENTTGEMSFEVWGWAETDESTLTPQNINVSDSTTMTCLIRDSNTTNPLQNYPVSFHSNNTSYLGTNHTNSTGHATWTFTDNTLGDELITCNITHNNTLHYNATAPYERQEVLFTTDGIPPTIAYTDPTPADSHNQTSTTVTINVTHTEQNPANITLNWNSVNQTQAYSGTHTTFTKSLLSEGTYTYYVWLNDTGGNSNSTLEQTVTVDPNNPIVTYNPPTLDNDSHTQNNWLYINATVTDTYLKNITLEWNGINETFDGNTGSTYFENKTGLTESQHNFTIYAEDWSGNIEKSQTRYITVDLTDPEVFLGPPADSHATSLTNIYFNYTPADTNIHHCELWANISGAWAFEQNDTTPASDISNRFDNFESLTENTKNLWNVKCVDVSGRTAWNSTNHTLNIDNENPNVTIKNISPTPVDAGYDDVTFNCTATDNFYIDTFIANITYPNGTLLYQSVNIKNFILTKANFTAIGTYNLLCWANDTAGHTDSDSQNFAVEDNKPPLLNTHSPQNRSGDNDAIIDFRYTVTDEASGIDSCELYIDSTLKNSTSDVQEGTTQTFSWSTINYTRYEWYITCTDDSPSANENTSATKELSILYTGTYDGSTTNFSNVDTHAISNMTIENTANGRIVYNETKDLSEGHDLYEHFIIYPNEVGVRNTHWVNFIDSSAQIFIYNLNWTYDPVVLDENKTLCSTCTFVSYDDIAGTLIFNTTTINVFQTTSNSNLVIWDETNLEGAYAGKTIGPDEDVTVFANYTNTTSAESITTATCSIEFATGGPLAMAWNSTKELYEYTTSFITNGYKVFNITCSDTGLEELTRFEGANIVSVINYNTNGTTCANSTAGTGSQLTNAIGQPDGTYASLNKLTEVYSTGYDTSGLVGHMIVIKSALTYYSTTKNHRTEIYYDLNGNYPNTYEFQAPDGGTSSAPLFHTYDHTSDWGEWTFEKVQDFRYRIYNDDWAATDYTYVDAICLNITYKNYMPNIFAEYPYANRTLVKENEWIRFNKVNITDDNEVSTVYFTINSANETTTKDGDSYSVDMQCTSSTTFNWTHVWANDTYNTGLWVNLSLDVVVDCDTDNPNAPSAIDIQGFEQGSWLTGTEATLECTEAGDIGPAGINPTSYIFQTNHTGLWENITGCIYSGNENLCYWTLPGDTSQDIYIRCSVEDLANHTSTWSPTASYAGIDNVAPTCDLTSPATDDNITSAIHTLSATSEDSASGVANVTFQYYDDTDGWTFACYDDTAPYSCNWNVDTGQEDTLDNRFRAICKDNTDRTNNSAQALSIIIDAINTPATCTMTYPNSAGIYENAYITIKADAEDSDPTDIVKNITFNYSSDNGDTWNPLGINTTENLEEYTYNWNTGILEGTDFLINCTAKDSRGASKHDTSDNTFTIDSSPPIITIDSPPNNSYLFAGTDILITVTDIYGSPDRSWYSLNSGIENTSTIDSDDIDTTGWNEGLNTIDYWANDTFSQQNHTLLSYTIDNTNPGVTGEHINASLVETNKPVCLNVTVTDNHNIDYVKAEMDIPAEQENTNVTLLDTGTDCDTISGDDVYSATFTPTFDGTYNWTLTWAKDMAGNMNRTVTAILGTSSSQSFMNLTMVSPASDLTINNTGTNNNYNQNCSVSCWDGGWDCDSVYLKIEYFYSSEWHIINKTTQNLTTDADNHSCGNMVHGSDPCSYEFTVTSDGASGGDTWPVRCKAESTNAPEETTASISITINDMPSTIFSEPATNLTWISGTYNLTCTITDTEGVDHTGFYNSTDGTSWDTTPGCTAVSGTNPECNFDTTTSACQEGAICYFKCTAYDTDGAHDTEARTARIDNTGPVSTLITPVNWANITTDTITVNATISDSGTGVISQAFFEYRINSSAQWNTACTDTDGDAYYNCTWDFTSSPDSLEYEVRVRANDTLGNLGTFNTHTGIRIDRNPPKITLNTPANNTLNTSTTLDFSFTPKDNLAQTMNCSLYLDDTYNTSNTTSQNNTLTTLIATIPQGQHTWKINCTDSIGTQNSSETRTFRIDYTAPSWSSQKQELGTTQTGIFHSGDTLNLSGTWHDNYLLKETLLSTNETGEWQNTSWTQMTGSTNTSSFSWQNNSISLGTVVGWKIYAKDSANLTNSTGTMTFTVWGWSKISSIAFTQNPVAPSSPTTIKCKVIDNLTSSALNSYTVSFYNSTSHVGTNTTEPDGWAYMQYSDDTIGDEEITCNITGNLTLHYNSSHENFKSSTLTITSGLETVYCESVTYSGGFTQGSCTELEVSDNTHFNWTNISDAAQANTNYARITTQADAPEFISGQINFTWEMTRHSDTTPDSKYRQPPAKGDLTYASLSDMYYEGDGLYGTLAEDIRQLSNLGLNFYVPELDTEVTYTKLGIKLVARRFSGGTTEGLKLHFWDFTSSTIVDPECLYFPASETSYATYTCETTTDVENLIDTNGMVRIRLEDEEIDTVNSHIWYIDYIDVRAYYDNPQANNVYSYRLDWYNNTGSVWVNGTLIDANGTDTTHILTISGPNVTDAMTADGNITGSLTFWQSGTPTQPATRYHEFNIDYFKVDVSYTLEDIDSITVTNTNITGETVDNTKITLKNMYEEKVSSATLTPSSASFTDNIAENYNYTLEVSSPLSSGSLNLILNNLNITDNLQIDLQTIEYYTGALPENDITGPVFAYNYIENITPVIALDDSQLTYNYASLTIPKNNLNISKILHCTDWNFGTKTCNTWEVNETADYSGFNENSTHFWFNATSFDSFGGGVKVSIPNITDISIYNVTGQADTHTGGTLLPGSGINTTIDFNVSADEKYTETWRTEITLRNDGDANWNILAEDNAYHEGLSTSWEIDTVNDIWYIVGPGTKTGGTWSGGRVTWDTSNGGLLQRGDTMTLYYVFNITPGESGTYPIYFLANDTSENAGSYDHSTYNITALGQVNSTLNAPPDNTLVPKDRNFTINATVWCWYGNCGIVNGTARYNATAQTPDTKIPVGTGSPLYIHNGPNPKSCGSMSEGESCTLTWSANATGTLRDQHEIDVEFTSTYPTNNDTTDSTITIGKILLMTLGFTSIDFGVVSPPETFPALNNTHNLYNITLDANSNNAEGGLWIKGENLTGVGSYEVDVSNMHWNATTHAAYETMTDHYSQIQSSMLSGTNTTTYYWVDTPLSTMLGTYSGTIYFMVNDTY